MRRSSVSKALAAAAVLALGGALGTAFGRTEAAPPTAIRSALAQTDTVQGAPERTLVLSKVVVQAGAHLALHRHLGTQVARIQSGVLTYTVRRGSVVVRTGESDQHPRVVRRIGAGQTGRIRAGQWLVEQPSDVHEAADRGGAPVVIFLATLLPTGAPPATPVTLPTSAGR
jgi:quercetin dioxygenase-like cupin family protein